MKKENKIEPKVAVILPCIGNIQFLKMTVESLFMSTNFPFKLLMIESESTDGTKEYCDFLAKASENVEVYHIPKKGLPNAINFGIKKAGDLDVFITQDDVIFFKLMGRDWLEDMNIASKIKDIATVGTLGGIGISGPDYVDKMRWVGTWAMYLPRKTINEIGLFDEKMRAGDDIDYAYRCMKAGKVLQMIDYWVQHHRFTTHSPGDTEEVKKKMAKYFREKYKGELEVKK